MHFYPGLSFKELESLDTPDIESLWQAITVLEAQETLVALKVQLYPQMKPNAQREYHRAVHRQAYPTSIYKPKQISIKDLDKMINRGQGGRPTT